MSCPRQIALFASALLLAAEPALAHGEGGLLGPVMWVGLAVGAFGGLVTALGDRHPGAGLAWSLAIFIGCIVAIVIWGISAAGVSRDDFWAVLVIGPVVVAFAGALPLALGFIVTLAVTGLARQQIHRWRAAN